jgi:hypothetical protein
VAHDRRSSTGSEDSEVRAMAKGRDRPRKQPKRKAKEKAPKLPPPSTPAYEPPASVEVIKPRRKEREPRDEE